MIHRVKKSNKEILTNVESEQSERSNRAVGIQAGPIPNGKDISNFQISAKEILTLQNLASQGDKPNVSMQALGFKRNSQKSTFGQKLLFKDNLPKITAAGRPFHKQNRPKYRHSENIFSQLG